jgi:Leucine-rich repeat (LRR) protein
MSYQTIEEYFTKFPDDVKEINVKFISNHLPDLSRFYKLKTLYCYNNQLTSLPLIPSTLKILYCYNNQLTSLPLLPSTLEILWCSNNKLTCLPLLPSTL